ncbi:nectin-2-like isoform X2 [Scyliorhinus torazame]
MVTLQLKLATIFLHIWSVCNAQNVKVEPNVYGYVGRQAVLRCQFIDPDNALQVTQVTWMKDPASSKINLAVYNPELGTHYPTDTAGRIHFRLPSIKDATLEIERLEMGDDGVYSCEFATYPDGNQEATTNLTILAKPKNQGSPVLVTAGLAEVPMAMCTSANGKPPASISWSRNVIGNITDTLTKNSDGTFTVNSEFRAVPSGEMDGVKMTCEVRQQTLERPDVIQITLSVKYIPIVIIEGYDDNWYVGREHASLTCSAKANPPASTYTWLMNGEPVPGSVTVNGHQLTVTDVTYDVNGTFTCQVTNDLGEGRSKMDVLVRETPQESGSTTGAIVGGIIAAIVILTVLVTAVLIFKRQRKNANEDEEDFEPPGYKPPPPKKNLEEAGKVEKTEVEKTENVPLKTTYYETGTEDETRMYYDEPDPNTDVKFPNDILPGVYLEQENPIYNELSYQEPEHRKSQEFVSKGMYV